MQLLTILYSYSLALFSNLRLMIFFCKITIISDIKETGSLSSLTENRQENNFRKKFNLHNLSIDILPSLKQMGFLDTSARNPDITIAGITLALQFGNALPKNIFGCKNITVVDCAARRAYPRAVA